jgi:radical SAM superfamily enzyme YgiQ (UPF0313 family)
MSCPDTVAGAFARESTSVAEVSPEDLAAAVVSTVAYSDMFGYPLDLNEIYRYLHGVSAERETVAAAVESLVREKRLVSDGCWYALAGRDRYFEQRSCRQRLASDLWRVARLYSKALATIPTVRMLGVTGSLAVDNTVAGADIDFMLVVEGGTVWRTRALANLMALLSHRFRGKMCVNFFVSQRALELEQRSLYIARELAQMVPIYGIDEYDRLRESNEWIYQYLPNASGPPDDVKPVKPLHVARSIGRPIMSSPPSAWLENWESQRKIYRYNETDFLPGTYSRFSREATGHRMNVRDEIEEIHNSRLRDDDPDRPSRILFGQSYHLYFDPKLWREMKPYPPLGSLYGAAVARQAGYDVRFFDSMLSTQNVDWEMSLDRHRPDVVVLFEDNFNYLTKMCLLRMRDAAIDMIGAARRIGATVVVCSSDATDHAALYLSAGAKLVIRGEGEQVLLQVLGQISGDPPGELADIAGISYRSEDGDLVENQRIPVIRALDHLPLPAWDLVDLKNYRHIWRQRHGTYSINLVTTRGCPYHCNWCAKPIWGQRYNSRSPENVTDELAMLTAFIKPDHIWFMDDIFGLKPGWVQRFADCLEQANVRIRFKCLTRPDLLCREGEVEALARAGCEVVWIGAESGSQKILDAMEKGTEVGNIEQTSARLKAHGIRVGHFIQFGYPGESWHDIRQTLGMLRRVLPDELGVSISYPLPGTPFHERVQADLGKKQNWQDSDDLAMLFHGPFSTVFYRCLHRYVHRDLAWHRTARQIRDGSFLRLPMSRQLRHLVKFAFHSVLVPPTWLRLQVLSLSGPRGLRELPTALDRKAAAVPSEQNTE